MDFEKENDGQEQEMEIGHQEIDDDIPYLK